MAIKHSYQLRKYYVRRFRSADARSHGSEDDNTPIQVGTPQSRAATTQERVRTVAFVGGAIALVLTWVALLGWLVYIAIF
jgi:hypothetical protein